MRITLFEACSTFTRVTACTLAKSLKDLLHRRLQPIRYLHGCSDCYRLERQLPGGFRTRWKTAPFHGALERGVRHQCALVAEWQLFHALYCAFRCASQQMPTRHPTSAASGLDFTWRTAIHDTGGDLKFLTSTRTSPWLLPSALPIFLFKKPCLLLPETGRNIVFPPMAVSSRILTDWSIQVDLR